jgi:hypothetical protein
MRKTISILASLRAIFAFVCGLQIAAAPVTLYDGSQSSTPDKQGWIYLLDPLVFNQARQVGADGGVNLNTLRNPNDHAGYFARVPLLTPHPNIPEEFSRERGYQIGFTIQLSSEVHVRPDRAGFNIIATSRDLMGIELSFWTDEVFAQSVAFIHSEGNKQLPFQLATEYVDFVLEISGDTYTLSGNGAEILTGPLRDYSGFGNPYNITDFLFFGDDTTSASASVNIRSIWIDTELSGTEPPPVVEPEPEPEPEPPVVGETALFTVDSDASNLAITGLVLGNALKSQAANSLTTTFGGEIHAVLSDSQIVIQPESIIDANPSGDWSPLPGGKSGKAPADYGGKATVFIASADAAARNIEFSLSSDNIALAADGAEFPVNTMTIAIPEESAAAVDIAVGGFLPLNTSQALNGLSGENSSDSNATISVQDNIQTISIPIKTDVSFRVISPNDATLTFTGMIVASRELPSEPEPPIVEPEPVTPPVPPVVVVPDTPPTLAINQLNPGEIQLTWDAVADRSYNIESSSNLSDWNTVGDSVTTDSESGTWTGPTSEGAAFYRIVLIPAN